MVKQRPNNSRNISSPYHIPRGGVATAAPPRQIFFESYQLPAFSLGRVQMLSGTNKWMSGAKNPGPLSLHPCGSQSRDLSPFAKGEIESGFSPSAAYS